MVADFLNVGKDIKNLAVDYNYNKENEEVEIHIKGTYVKKDEIKTTIFNKILGCLVETKKIKTKEIPIDYTTKVGMSSFYFPFINSEIIKEAVIESLTYSLIKNIVDRKTLEAEEEAFEKLLVENVIDFSYQFSHERNGIQYYELSKKNISLNDLDFEKKIIKKTKEKLSDEDIKKLDFYLDNVFFNIKGTEYAPYLIGGYNSVYPRDFKSSTVYKYSLPALFVKYDIENEKFYTEEQDFFIQSMIENFWLVGFTSSEKELDQLSEEEYIPFKPFYDYVKRKCNKDKYQTEKEKLIKKMVETVKKEASQTINNII